MPTDALSELRSFTPFLTSLGLGLVMGLERERRLGARAGLRTFALSSLMGTACALLAQLSGASWLLPLAFLAVALMMIAADRQNPAPHAEPDTTSTVALLLCFVYGALLWYGHTLPVVALSLLSTALLYFKAELHAMAHISRQEMVSLLQFATISFVILPVLPDRGFGPYAALNPYRIWLMVVLIAGISLAGYVALRLLGQRRLPVLLGLLGGLVSSTATTLVYSRKAHGQPQLAGAATQVIVTANLVLLLRVCAVTGVVAPTLLPALLLMLGPAWLAGTALLLQRLRGSASAIADGESLSMRNPLEMGAALSFGLMYGAALLITAWLHDLAGAGGVYAIAPVLGLTDVDAATLSTLRLYNSAEMSSAQAATTLLLAVGSNMLFKGGIALVLGGSTLGWRVARAFIVVFAGLVAGLLLVRNYL